MEGEGFSPDFNWNTFKEDRSLTREQLLQAERVRIEKQIKQDLENHILYESSPIKLSNKLSTSDHVLLIKELCTRFPGRVLGEDCDGKWCIDPTASVILGSRYYIKFSN